MAHLFLHTNSSTTIDHLLLAGGDVRHSNRQTQKKKKKSQIKIVRRCDGSLPPPVSVLDITQNVNAGIFVQFPYTTSHRKKQVNGKKSSYTQMPQPFSLLFAFDGNSTGEMCAGGKEKKKFREILMMAHTSKGRSRGEREKYTIARQLAQRLKHFD